MTYRFRPPCLGWRDFRHVLNHRGWERARTQDIENRRTGSAAGGANVMKGFTDLFVCAYATDSSRLTINHLTRQPPRCRITGFMESRAWGDLAHELTADGFGHPKRVSYNGNEATISRLAPNGSCG